MIRFRPLAEEDFPMLLDWLQREHVKEWWDDGDDALDKVSAHYGAADGTKRFIAQRDDLAIGYFQYSRSTEHQIFCDQFLANAADLSRGIGTECLSEFIALVADVDAPHALLVDPVPANRRAIRCYEKCGFVYDQSLSSDSLYCMVRVLRRVIDTQSETKAR